MHVWLITIAEAVPLEGTGVRPRRAGLLASRLAFDGHTVVWWASTFDHFKKRLLFEVDTDIDISERFRVKLLHTKVTYRSNVSLARIRNHRALAKRFLSEASSEEKPDIILCSIPTVDFAIAATTYGKEHGIPVVIDVRDLWPDIFVELAPAGGRWLARGLLAPMFNAARVSCAGATAITGVTSAFVDWGVRYAGRQRTNLDREFPLGYSAAAVADDAVLESVSRWQAMGVTRDQFVVCFFGNIGRQFDLKTVLEAARILATGSRSFRFVLCGDGDRLDAYRRQASRCSNVIFPGWVGAPDMLGLMRLSSVGIAPYNRSVNFASHIPNKPIEYLYGALPVVTGLGGTLGKLLSDNDCGVSYENGNSEDLAARLVELHDRPERVRRMATNARALYESRFTAEKVYGEMSAYLAEVCDWSRQHPDDGRERKGE